MKIGEIPKKIYELQVKTIKLSEEITKAKIDKKNYSDGIIIDIANELNEDGKKKFKNAQEREMEFARVVLRDPDFLKMDEDLRLQEIKLKKTRYQVEYYSNVLKGLPFKEAEVEDIE